MNEQIQTDRFTIDRAAYLRTMYTYNLWRPLAFVFLWFGAALAGMAALLGASEALEGVIGLLIALPFILVVRYFRARGNVYSPESRQTFDDPRTITFSDEGIRVRTEAGADSQFPWSYVIKTVQRGGSTLLFAGKNVHVVVPDSAFGSPADRQEFSSLIEERVPKRTRSGR